MPKLLLFTSISLFLLVSCNKKTIEKPNVLFILADDLGYHDLSITGSNYYETPNIDGIAERGVQFTQGYAACQVCSPSRAAIITGKSPARLQITDWIGAATGEEWRKQNRHDKILPAEYIHQLPQSEITIAEAFTENGYQTFFAGKWHLGDEGSYPEDHGFQINIGGTDKGSPMGGYFDPYDNPKLPNREPGENLPMRFAKETAEFIKSNDDKPFLAYLSFYAVHGPIQTTEEKWQKYRDKAESQGITSAGFEMERVLPIRRKQDNPVYAGLVEQMDNAVGLVLEALREAGLDKNTIVVFTSDNGGVASGDAFSTSNLPLRGGKGYQWEGGIREPYFVHVPWMEDAPKIIKTPVTGTDFYPTLLELTGLPAKPNQHLDGVSIVPLLKGESINKRPLFWHYPHYGNQGGEPSSIIRDGDWKLIHYYEDGRDELYNLAKTIGETENFTKHNPAKTKELRNKLDNWLKETNAAMPSQDPEFDEAKRAVYRQNIIDKKLPQLEKQRLDFLKKDFKPNATWWGSKVTVD
ncbi:MAG: arylsulfatase A-like enzyme [Spirosomataceae bacterium]|jgi:arylsulfatase A-like enzyme